MTVTVQDLPVRNGGGGTGTHYTVPLVIDGREVQSERSFDVVSPATGRVVHQCSSVSEAEAAAAVDAAGRAFDAWRRTPPRKRRDILLRAAEIMGRRQEELIGYMVDETGCAPGWAEFNLGVARDFITDVAGRISSLEGTCPDTQDENTGALVLKEPFGVVLAISPWNATYILGARAVAFPLAAGNTVVFKATELSPRASWAIVSVFQEAGLPAGVLNLVVHEPARAAAITEALIAHPLVKKINFTGSTSVGRIIGRLAGEHLKPALLELGGKASAIVWEDADLDNAAVQCALGAFLNSGQICMSTERILVHKSVRAAFEKKFKETIDHIFPAEDGGLVLINAASAEKNKRLLDDAVGKGAQVLHGEAHAAAATDAAGEGTETSNKGGTRMRPTVVSGVTPAMDLYKTESFGPSVSLFEIETEDEAVRIANDTEYGLTSAVFTEDLRRGLRLAKQIEAGAVHINSMTVHDETALPHGGVKASGFGRFNASGLHEWVRTKSVTYKF